MKLIFDTWNLEKIKENMNNIDNFDLNEFENNLKKKCLISLKKRPQVA